MQYFWVGKSGQVKGRPACGLCIPEVCLLRLWTLREGGERPALECEVSSQFVHSLIAYKETAAELLPQRTGKQLSW